MNDLRIPVAVLAVIIVALGAWLVFGRPKPVPTPPQTSSVATTTAIAPDPEPATPAPTLDPSDVAANIAGNWQSTDDANYSVVVGPGDAWKDSYKSGASSTVSETGTYELFTSADPDPDFTGTPVSGVIYLKVSEGTSVLFYSVLTASNDELQLNYLDRGNTLSFVRVQ